jgi:adenylate kinase family enzyme
VFVVSTMMKTNLKKILVIGSPGSGKSTFSLKLGDILNIPVYHLDKIYWSEKWVRKSETMYLADLNNVMKEDDFIIDGDYFNSLNKRLVKANLIIWLKINRARCILNILHRIFHCRKEKDRQDITLNCKEKINLTFLKEVWNYQKKSYIRLRMIKSKKYVHLITLNNYHEITLFLKFATFWYSKDKS